jgi:hypothetical protein
LLVVGPPISNTDLVVCQTGSGRSVGSHDGRSVGLHDGGSVGVRDLNQIPYGFVLKFCEIHTQTLQDFVLEFLGTSRCDTDHNNNAFSQYLRISMMDEMTNGGQEEQ